MKADAQNYLAQMQKGRESDHGNVFCIVDRRRLQAARLGPKTLTPVHAAGPAQ
jgi:hypothetical protein